MEQRVTATSQVSNKTKDVVISGLLIALVFVATYFIKFQLPFSLKGGLVHTGNVALFVAAIVFGKKKGAIAGAFGMGLFDVVSGWMSWAPFTFVIRGVMGYMIGSIAHARGRNGNNIVWNLVAIAISSVWMMFGYYMTEVILYGNWVAPLTSIPGNITQIVIGIIAGVPLAFALKKALRI
ncbi:MAG: ECF transporter S component [Clostridia bacterium]|nr:ECF transporter S component [Clostridia bacterium]